MSLAASLPALALVLILQGAPDAAPGDAPPQATAAEASGAPPPAPAFTPAAEPLSEPAVPATRSAPLDAEDEEDEGEEGPSEESTDEGEDSEPPPPPPPPGYVPNEALLQSRIQRAYVATERRLGPINGTWVLAGADGASLLRLELVDRGVAYPLEGAWSDIRAQGSVHANGVLAGIYRSDTGLVINFARSDGQQTVITLAPRPVSGFAGEMVRAGATTSVVMSRP